MRVIHDVQRQPRCDCVMNPPAIGPATGPANPPAAKTQIAYDRGIGSHRSASAPPTTARGADAKKPPRNLPTHIVVMFWARATGIWKMANSANPKKRGILRPRTSDIGPKAMGPNTNPSTNSATPRVAVTSSTLYNSCTVRMLTLNMELANVTVKTRRPMDIVIAHRRFAVQFLGLPGSFGPSNSTKTLSSVFGGGSSSLRPFSTSANASFGSLGAPKLSRGFSSSVGALADDVGVEDVRLGDGPASAVFIAIIPSGLGKSRRSKTSRNGEDGVFVSRKLRRRLVVISGICGVKCVHIPEKLRQRLLRQSTSRVETSLGCSISGSVYGVQDNGMLK
jgi:hypothetical protein